MIEVIAGGAVGLLLGATVRLLVTNDGPMEDAFLRIWRPIKSLFRDLLRESND
jgi:hypothetical protein